MVLINSKYQKKYHNLIRDLVVVLFKEHIRSMNESEDDVIKNAEDNEILILVMLLK